MGSSIMSKRLMAFSAFTIILLTVLCGISAAAYDDEGMDTLSFTSEEKDYIYSHKSLRVGYVQDRIPVSFSNDNGEADGISRYIFDRVSKLSGLNFEYVALPTNDVTYDYLLSEKIDLITSVEFNSENQKARGILISKPYLSSHKVIIARENFEFKLDEGYSVAISTGSQTLKKVLSNMFPNFVLKDYDSINACFDAVNAGEADMMIQNQYVAEYWLSNPKNEKLKVIPVVGLDDMLCFSAMVGLDKNQGPTHEDGEILISILNKTIDNISEDELGSYIIQGVMENQYKYTLSDFLTRYRYTIMILGITFIVIIILAVMIIRQRIRITESRADSKAKGQFLSTMSHEIRTPLNGLIGLNHLMHQKLEDKEKMEEYLEQSSMISKYLLSLVNDILDSSKLENEKMELVHQTLNIKTLLETVSAVERSAMDDKKLNFTVHGEMTNPHIIGDETRIQQVLLNLLDNARKFTNEGGNVELFIKQELIDNNKVFTTVVVSDNGRGMSDEFQKKIFDVFSQENVTVSKGNQGTGLGLYISRRLARLMGGDLTCVSKKDEGSIFTFTFVAETSEPFEKPEQHFVAPDRKHSRVLVAEDNEINGEILLELLRYEGFEVDVAENGKKVLDMFSDSATGTYGVILMDLLMPEMNGFEAAKAIRALHRPDAKAVRIIACTANSFSEERDKALACGMDDFIAKPVDVEELLEKIYK